MNIQIKKNVEGIRGEYIEKHPNITLPLQNTVHNTLHKSSECQNVLICANGEAMLI